MSQAIPLVHDYATPLRAQARLFGLVGNYTIGAVGVHLIGRHLTRSKIGLKECAKNSSINDNLSRSDDNGYWTRAAAAAVAKRHMRATHCVEDTCVTRSHWKHTATRTHTTTYTYAGTWDRHGHLLTHNTHIPFNTLNTEYIQTT